MNLIKNQFLVFLLALNTSLMPTYNSEVWADIVVFLDNDISLKLHRQTYHQLIKRAYAIACDVDKEIIFVPIGNGDFKYATNFKTAEELFTFNYGEHFISETFNNAIDNGIIPSKNQSIVIISSMASSITNNKSEMFQFTSLDYEDTLKWYNIISQWLSRDISLYIFLLTNNELEHLYSIKLNKKDIEKQLSKLIDFSKRHEEYEKNILLLDPNRKKSMTYIRNQKFNRNLIYSALLSLTPDIMDQETGDSLLGQFYLTQIFPKSFDNIINSLEEIIDPNAVRKLKVKIEIDPNVINLDHPDQEYVRNLLYKKVQYSITNSSKFFEYQILNGPTKSKHDQSFHYHYRIKKESEKSMVNIILTNKAITTYGKKYLMKEKSRNVLYMSYSDIQDLILKVSKELEHLIEYQEKDFPAREKNIKILLKTETSYLFKGNRLAAVPKKGNFSLTESKYLSTIIGDDGRCHLKLQRNTDFELFLNLYSYENSDFPDEKHVPIGNITQEMILGKKECSIEANVVNKLKTLDIKTSSDLKGKIIFTPYNYNESGYFDIVAISIPVEKTSVQLHPCSYFYTVLFNYQLNSCLNTWLTPIHLSNENSQIIVNCIDDQLNTNESFDIFDEMIAEIIKSMDFYSALPVVGKNELTGTFESHLFGSPHFFPRLFQYTAQKDPTGQTIEMKELWRRIYFTIFIDTKFSKNLIPTIFDPAIRNLGFDFDDNSNDPRIEEISRLIKTKYLKILLKKYFLNKLYIYINPEEQYLYNEEILVLIQEHLNLNQKFINKLRIQ